MVWYGMVLITPGLLAYQRKKRQESEEKIILFLLEDIEPCGVRRIWRMTHLYKNNIRPILDKLVDENKIIRFDHILIQEFYEDKQKYLHERNVRRTVYIPNLKNKYVFNLLRNRLPKLLIAQNRKWCKKGAKLFLDLYNEYYKEFTIEHALVLERGTRKHIDVKNGPDEIEIMHAWSWGIALCFALRLTKQLHEKIPNLTQLEKILNVNLKIKKEKN